jgi:hypothetical protein
MSLRMVSECHEFPRSQLRPGRATAREPTRHLVEVKKLLSWLKVPGRFPPDEQRKAKLRKLAK